MKVADLYIALVLIGVCVGAGWVAHEWIADKEERLEKIEGKLSPNKDKGRLYFSIHQPQLSEELIKQLVSDYGLGVTEHTENAAVSH